MKIVLTDFHTVSSGDIDFSPLEQFGEVCYYPETPKDKIIERIKDADIVICNKTVIGRQELDGAENLKLISLFATGYNNIDVEYAAQKGIAVCNAGTYSTNAVAQQVFGYILNHACKISVYNQDVHGGSWINSRLFSAFSHPTAELEGKVLGIYGLGAIGKRVAKLGAAFGMRIIACTRTVRPELCDFAVEYVDFDTLLAQSDYLSIHCPLTDETRGLMGEEQFAKMKKTAFFINTSRGAVIDEAALRDALNNDVISGAAVDVLTTEPMSADCVLLDAKNVVFTPHVAWAAYETRCRVLEINVENIRRFLAGVPQNKVN